MTQERASLTRREAIRRAVLLVGGVASAAQITVIEHVFAADATDSTPTFLSDDHLAMLARIADLIIPETDTPGAVSAGVPGFIDRMLAEWASTETQRQFVAGFDDIERRAVDAGMQSFIGASAERQFELLVQLDREAFADASTDAFFRRMKKLVLFSYFSSEPGATQALRYDRVPGRYDPCMSLEEDGRAWFWLGFSYEL